MLCMPWTDFTPISLAKEQNKLASRASSMSGQDMNSAATASALYHNNTDDTPVDQTRAVEYPPPRPVDD